MSGFPRTLGEIRALGKEPPTGPGVVKKCSSGQNHCEAGESGGNEYAHSFSSHPLICWYLPLAKPNQKPDGKGIWVVESVEVRVSGHRTKQRKIEKRSVWKMEYNNLLAVKSWRHL